ncbi:MAG: ATP-binding protein [Anaerolineaceae bacterium]
MGNFLQSIFVLLTRTPGNLIYYLVLAFTITAALQSVLVSRRTTTFPFSGRMIFGLSLILVSQIILFYSGGLVWQRLAGPPDFLPVLERATATFALICIIWMWAFPLPSRALDIIVGMLTIFLVIFFVYCLTNWTNHDPSLQFNNYWLDQIWQMLSIAIAVIGIFLLIYERPETWAIGLWFLAINLVGHTAQFLGITASGDYPAAVRLAQLCAYPLVPFLSQRLHPSPTIVEAPPKVEIPRPPNQERRRYTASARAVYAWLKISTETDPARIGPAVTRAVGQTMLADLCFLISPPTSSGEVIIHSGYDLIREEEMESTALDQSKIPLLANAVQRGRPLRLICEDSVPTDLKIVCDSVGLQQPGNLMLIPLLISQKVWGALLLLSPYSNRVWNTEDQNYLGSTTEMIAQLLQQANSQTRNYAETSQLQEELQTAQARVDQLEDENKNLGDEIERRSQITGPDVNTEALIVLEKESQELIAKLQVENQRLKEDLEKSITALPDEAAENLTNFKAELRLALQEVAQLQNALGDANAKITILEKTSSESAALPDETSEVIASIAQELRQPMSSITGYTDLLLSESVGILGALQRKFLERIKSSTERMRLLLDDLIKTTAIDKGSLELVAQPVDLGKVIDQSISDTSAQMRERNITLRVDLPEELPQVYTDLDALQQIFIHLLENAGTVTPREGTIILRAHMEQAPGKSSLLVQVTDHGGGISPEDLPRVFARHYRAENPLIQGVGDTGVGLSITKTLVESLGGNIWVESQPGQSSTFSVRLPTREENDRLKPSP